MKTFLLLVFCILAIAHEGWSQDDSDDREAKAQATFKRYDTDNSGFFDDTEIKAFYAQYDFSDELMKKIIDGYMQRYDADGDGRITFDEFFNKFSDDWHKAN